MKIKLTFLLCLLVGGCTILVVYWYLPNVTVTKKVSRNPTGITVGLLSDTHVPASTSNVQQKVFDVFQTAKVDYIIHAGDITSQNVIERLEKIAPVIAVYGNHAPASIEEKIPEVNSLSVAGYNIGVWHNPFFTNRDQRALDLAHERDFDLLVIGHSHKQRFLHTQGVYLFNPGSSTNAFPPLLVKPTVAVLHLNAEPTVQFIDVSTSAFGGPGLWGELAFLSSITFLLFLGGILYRILQ